MKRRQWLATSTASSVGLVGLTGCQRSLTSSEPWFDETFMRSVLAASLGVPDGQLDHWAKYLITRLDQLPHEERDVAAQGLRVLYQRETPQAWEQGGARLVREQLDLILQWQGGDAVSLKLALLLAYTLLGVAPGFVDDVLGYPVSVSGQRCKYWGKYDEPPR